MKSFRNVLYGTGCGWATGAWGFRIRGRAARRRRDGRQSRIGNPKSLIACLIVVGLLHSVASGAITLSCEPESSVIGSGQTVEVTCFISTTEEITIAGTQIDLPCSLPGKSGSLGTIVVSDVSVDVIRSDFAFSPTFTGELFPGVGFTNPGECTAGGAPPPVFPLGSATLPAGTTAYLATYVFEVSECAEGEFNIVLENFSDPPADEDLTKVRASATILLPFTVVINTITVEECTCQTDEECDDGNECTIDRCVKGVCVHDHDRQPCDDGLFCTAIDTCIDGVCVSTGSPCTGDLLCSEQLGECVECLRDSDCDDGNICTTDTCSESGSCLFENNNADCQDGLFCTLSDACVGGSCTGLGSPCSGGQLCDEGLNRCVDCTDDVHCDDSAFCNGQEQCNDGDCFAGSDPCPGQLCSEGLGRCVECTGDLHCDDSVFCNGQEQCNDGECVVGSDPCPDSFCNEDLARCSELIIVSSDPPAGAIDAGQPLDPEEGGPAGWQSVELTFNGAVDGLDTGDFWLAQEGPARLQRTEGLRYAAQAKAGGSQGLFVVEVTVVGEQVVEVLWSDPMVPGSWLTITHVDSGTSTRLGYLPADVTADGTDSPRDILALIDGLNGVGDPQLDCMGPCPWSLDVNRSGEANIKDVLREMELLNGTDDFDVWNGQSFP